MKKKKNKLTIEKIKRSEGVQVRSVISKIKAKEVELTIISVIVILSIIITSSYFVFTSISKNKQETILKTGTLEVAFKETETGIEDIISITNSSAIIDSKSKVLKPYSFTIKNTSKKTKKYKVFLQKDNNMIEVDNCKNSLYDNKYIKYSIDNKKIFNLEKMENIYQIYEETIKGNEEKKHELRIWVSNNIKEKTNNKHFHAKIIIKSTDEKEEIINP